jgi:hypothetical protein
MSDDHKQCGLLMLDCAIERDSKMTVAMSHKYANIFTERPGQQISSVALNPDDAKKAGELLLAWAKAHGGR